MNDFHQPCVSIAVMKQDGSDSGCTLHIYEKKTRTLFHTPHDQLLHLEEPIQLLEGNGYEYSFSQPEFKLDDSTPLISPSKATPHTGTINVGLYIGRFVLQIIRPDGSIYSYPIEMRSMKLGDKEQYFKMLSDITAECSELLLLHSTPTTQSYTVDETENLQTLYQQFSIIRAIVETEAFDDAINHILASPSSTLISSQELQDIRKPNRFSTAQLRQLASTPSRIPVPSNHPLYQHMHTIPRVISSEVKRASVDNIENRFIKYVLKDYHQLCGFVAQKSWELSPKNPPFLHQEAQYLEQKLFNHLRHPLFREVGSLSSLPLNNPTIHGKTGYREIFQMWLTCRMSINLSFDLGLDKVNYHMGQRNVADTYEYWLFFQLFNTSKPIFELDELDEVIEPTSSGFELKLKSGTKLAINGHFSYKKHHFNASFHYNRTFSPVKSHTSIGSYSRIMRPDYTIAVWPNTHTNEEEAASKKQLYFIHFDAKYRFKLTNFKALKAHNTKETLEAEKRLEQESVYQRGDLLKMHAYKDSIYHTVGAYVLYPGSAIKSHMYQQTDKLIPSVGAIPLAPTAKEKQAQHLINLLKSFKEQICSAHIASLASSQP